MAASQNSQFLGLGCRGVEGVEGVALAMARAGSARAPREVTSRDDLLGPRPRGRAAPAEAAAVAAAAGAGAAGSTTPALASASASGSASGSGLGSGVGSFPPGGEEPLEPAEAEAEEGGGGGDAAEAGAEAGAGGDSAPRDSLWAAEGWGVRAGVMAAALLLCGCFVWSNCSPGAWVTIRITGPAKEQVRAALLGAAQLPGGGRSLDTSLKPRQQLGCLLESPSLTCLVDSTVGAIEEGLSTPLPNQTMPIQPTWTLSVNPATGADEITFTAFEFSLMSSVHLMWAHSGKVLAVVIFFLSGLWPYIKIALMVVTFCVPLRPARRATLFWVLETLGKWSLIDMYVFSMMVAGFRLHLDLGSLASLDVGLVCDTGLYLFCLGVILSHLYSHWLAYLHHSKQVGAARPSSRRGPSPPPPRRQFDHMPLTALMMLTMMLRLRRRIARIDEQYEHRPVAAAEGHATRYPMMQHSGWRPAWQWTVLAGLVVTLGLTLAGQFLPSVDFTFSGLAGAALGDEANSKVRSDPHAPMCVCVCGRTRGCGQRRMPICPHGDMSTRSRRTCRRARACADSTGSSSSGGGRAGRRPRLTQPPGPPPRWRQVYSLAEAGTMIRQDLDTAPKHLWGDWFLTISYYAFGIVLPLVRVLVITVLWAAPLSARGKQVAHEVCSLCGSWSALDVFVVTVILCRWEISAFIGALVEDDCGIIEDIIGMACLELTCYLLEGTWFLLAALVLDTAANRTCMFVYNRKIKAQELHNRSLPAAKGGGIPPAGEGKGAEVELSSGGVA